MSKYIDADEYAKKLDYPWEYYFSQSQSTEGIDTALSILEDMPSADVVEVVRCKDCIHAEVGEKDVWCEYYESYKKKDGYCDFGERKESKIKKCFDIPKEIAEMLLEDTERKETE